VLDWDLSSEFWSAKFEQLTKIIFWKHLNDLNSDYVVGLICNDGRVISFGSLGFWNRQTELIFWLVSQSLNEIFLILDH
jgi:hypothetical protein